MQFHKNLTNIFIFTLSILHTYMHLYVHACTCMHTCMCVIIHACTCTCNMNTLIPCVLAHLYKVCVYVCVCVHAHMNTPHPYEHTTPI